MVMSDEINNPIQNQPFPEQPLDAQPVEEQVATPEAGSENLEYEVVASDLGTVSIGDVEIDGKVQHHSLLAPRIAERFGDVIDMVAAHPKVAPFNEGIGNFTGHTPSEVVKNRFTDRVESGVANSVNKHPFLQRIDKPAAKVAEHVTVDRARKAVELARMYSERNAA